MADTTYVRSGQKARDERNADKANDSADAAAGSSINKGDLGSMGKAGKTPMPKMSDYPGDLPGYSSAMRKWRQDQESDTDNIAQKKALREMGSK